jgi:hypothetical protein
MNAPASALRVGRQKAKRFRFCRYRLRELPTAAYGSTPSVNQGVRCLYLSAPPVIPAIKRSKNRL